MQQYPPIDSKKPTGLGEGLAPITHLSGKGRNDVRRQATSPSKLRHRAKHNPITADKAVAKYHRAISTWSYPVLSWKEWHSSVAGPFPIVPTVESCCGDKGMLQFEWHIPRGLPWILEGYCNTNNAMKKVLPLVFGSRPRPLPTISYIGFIRKSQDRTGFVIII